MSVAKSALLALAAAVGGAVYGLLTSLIPSPQGTAAFWISNLSSPWLVLAFLAGWSQRSWLWAAVAGVLADVFAVSGFYFQFLVYDEHGGYRGYTPPPLLTLIRSNLSGWLHFVAPWLLAALVAGIAYGLLGRWWGARRSVVAGIAVTVPFVFEPLAWFAYYGFWRGPAVLWFGEALVGVGLSLLVIAVLRRHGRTRLRT
ncbi:DUF6518 family protein [Actinophytocola sp.]|uniref:DUF6518 family protein n=1 Tax=Actinophytocola sp. TaxID=1872138 RepID=UPI00389A63AF